MSGYVEMDVEARDELVRVFKAARHAAEVMRRLGLGHCEVKRLLGAATDLGCVLSEPYEPEDHEGEEIQVDEGWVQL